MTKPKKKPTRPKRLSDADLSKIMASLDAWSGPLTWNLLLDEVERITSFRYTRQGLHVHEMIRTAFVHRKSRIGSLDRPVPKVSAALQSAEERIRRLQATVERQQKQINNLLAQAARFIYNSQKMGLDPIILNRPMRAVDREATRKRPEED